MGGYLGGGDGNLDTGGVKAREELLERSALDPAATGCGGMQRFGKYRYDRVRCHVIACSYL